MTAQELLRMFIAEVGEIRNLDNIYRGNGFLYASNGHVLIRIDDDQSIEASPSDDNKIKWPEKMQAVLDKWPHGDAEFVLLPEIAEPDNLCDQCFGTGSIEDVKRCEACGGYGEIEITRGKREYTVPCPECDGACEVPDATAPRILHDKCAGTGKLYPHDQQRIGQRRFSTRYTLLLRRLPDARFALDAEAAGDPLMFRGECDGKQFIGLAMPLYPKRVVK